MGATTWANHVRLFLRSNVCVSISICQGIFPSLAGWLTVEWQRSTLLQHTIVRRLQRADSEHHRHYIIVHMAPLNYESRCCCTRRCYY